MRRGRGGPTFVALPSGLWDRAYPPPPFYHHLEKGIDLRYLKTLLGNRSPRTTEIHVHRSSKVMDNIRSPLDALDIGSRPKVYMPHG